MGGVLEGEMTSVCVSDGVCDEVCFSACPSQINATFTDNNG